MSQEETTPDTWIEWGRQEFHTGLTNEQLAQLMSPLHPSRVAKRSQGGTTLSYVEAYDIKAMLIRVFGFGGFSADVIDSRIIQVREAPTVPTHTKRDGTPNTPQAIAQATVRLHIPSLGCTYTETAVGSNSGFDIGDICDNAIKSAASDALKRCATYLGTQFGLGLYNNGSLSEVVRRIFEPNQAKQLEEINAAKPDPVEAARTSIEHALGAQEVK